MSDQKLENAKQAEQKPLRKQSGLPKQVYYQPLLLF